jgi:nucleoside-diphosphate-sugar epimerase
MSENLPAVIENEAILDDVMTRPDPLLIESIKTLSSPLVILGAGGKMGPSMAVLARRAADAARHPLDILAVSRFSDGRARQWLKARGVQTISCDVMDRNALAGLPDTQNLIYLVGLKFGTSQEPSMTWAANTLAPAHIAERYAEARIVALSTGNVYPLSPVGGAGSLEIDPLTPTGEYANSCVARERIFEFFSRRNGTPLTLIRLNYAVEMRYGVLVDIARKVFAGEPVDVLMGYLNCIWQGDANSLIIRCLGLASSPPFILNLTGSTVVSVREVAQRFGELMNHLPIIVGAEASTALLSNTARMVDRLGKPQTPLDRLIEWTAHWIMNDGRLLNKPTHFEVRDGAY